MTERSTLWDYAEALPETAARRPKPIPWIRILVDLALLAAMAVVSSRLFYP